MTNQQLWNAIGALPDDDILDALPPSWAPDARAAAAPRRASRVLGFFLDNGWVAAVASVVVAVAVIVAIVLAGQGDPPLPPVGTNAPESETESLAESVTETHPESLPESLPESVTDTESESETVPERETTPETRDEPPPETEPPETAPETEPAPETAPPLAAVPTTPSKGLEFVVKSYEDNTCTVMGLGSCTDTVVVIPETSPEGATVVEISTYAFENRSNLRKVILPDTVTEIGLGAFAGCMSLEYVHLPEGVTRIANEAFADCTKLTDLVIPASVTSIERDAFIRAGIKRLRIADLDAWCRIPFKSEWANPMKVASKIYIEEVEPVHITLPAGVDLSDYAFNHCTSLVSVTIPMNVEYIRAYAFYECKNLSAITYEGTAEQWKQIFVGDNPTANYTITCTGTGEIPLVEATGLVFASNGDGTCTLTGLGTCADVRIILPDRSPEGDLVTAIANAVFYEHKTILEVHLPSGVTCVPSFYNSPSLKRVKLSPSVTELDARCFNSCVSLEEVDFNGAAVTVIPSHAFGSSGLTSITLPEGVTELPDFAFSGCKNLASVIHGAGLTKVGERAFDGCKQLVEFRAASSEYSLDTLTVIGASAFRETVLAKVAFSDDLSVIGESAFQYLRTKSVIDLSRTKLTYLPALAFDSSTLTGMILPEGMTTVGYRAFGGCVSLTSVTLPDSLTRIDGEAFAGCGKIGEVRLGSSLTTIGERAFEGVSAPIVWCDNPTIQTIGGASFAGYLGTSIVFPDSVTAIGGSALSDCPNLQILQIPFVGGKREDTGGSTDCFGHLFSGGVDVWDQGDVIPASLKTVIFHGDGIHTRDFMDAQIETIVLGKDVLSISISGFENVTTLRNVYYEGSSAEWATVNNQSAEVSAATLWFYSEEKPTDTAGHYWHYDEAGGIVRWS